MTSPKEIHHTYALNIVFYIAVTLLSLLFALFLQTQFFPNDLTLRQAPKLGDIYFIDHFKLSQDPAHSPFPHKMARLVRIDSKRQLLTLNVTTWSYKTKYRLIKDYLGKQDNYFSNFSYQNLHVPFSALKDKDLVWQIRRRSVPLDIERYQQRPKSKVNQKIRVPQRKD